METHASDVAMLYVKPEQRTLLLRRILESQRFVNQELDYCRKDGSTFVAGTVRECHASAAHAAQCHRSAVASGAEWATRPIRFRHQS